MREKGDRLKSELDMQMRKGEGYWAAWREVPGWFSAIDVVLFKTLLGEQFKESAPGDILEIGAFLGKSALLLGEYTSEESVLHVCDIFGGDLEGSNANEVEASYDRYNVDAFKANFERYGISSPYIWQIDSRLLTTKMQPDSCRFIHVDGSHLYDVVATDLKTSILLANSDAWIVFDDYRSPHTPGVAAAVWSAIDSGELVPVLLSQTKLYARLPESKNINVMKLLREIELAGISTELQRIQGHDVWRFFVVPEDNMYSLVRGRDRWVPSGVRDFLRKILGKI